MEDTELNERKQRKVYDLLASWKRTNAIIVNVFVFVVIAIFPLSFHNFYYDILATKYIFYYGTVILTAISMLVAAVIFLWTDWNYYQWQHIKKLYHSLSIKSLRKCDWAMIAFVFICIISTFQSEYFYESFWGNEGRYMGLFLILLYGVSYFFISRFFVLKKWHLDVFLAAGMIACLIGILQYFYIDPIGFKKDIIYEQYNVFASTFGNINTYTSYVALVVGAGIAAYATESNFASRRWYLFTIIVSLFALITGISDNAYLAMAAVFGLLPLYLFNNLKGIKRYLLVVAILFTEFQVIDLVNQKFPDKVLGISSLFDVIAGYKYLAAFVFVLWAITIALHVLDTRLDRGNKPRKNGNGGRWIWFGLIIVIVLGMCYLLYDVNIGGNADRYGSLKGYLTMSDSWGSDRGYIWRISLESFRKFPFIHKLFGFGPDTFGIVTVLSYYEEMATRYGVVFDSAHNEYLQYLVTIGIAGLVSYLFLLLSSIVRMIRISKKNPVLIAVVFAILCYGAQALVNISLPIVSPIMLTLLMMGVAVGNEVEDGDGTAEEKAEMLIERAEAVEETDWKE